MDDLFSKLALQAVTTVGKAAFGLAVNKAVQRLKDYSQAQAGQGAQGTHRAAGQGETHGANSTLIKEEMSDEIRAEFEQLDDLRAKLQQKIAILTPSIDMIQVVCAKSNNLGLHAVLNMASDLNHEMDDLSVLLNQVLGSSASSSASLPPAVVNRSPAETLTLARAVTARVQRIMDKIEDSVPYINLALSISGVKLGQFTPASSANAALLPGGGISLHTWFNASNLVAAAEPEHNTSDDGTAMGDWVPMTFVCRVYRLFEASVRAEGLPNWTWKLEHLRSHVRVWRHVPGAEDPGASQLVVEEATPMPGEAPAVLTFPLMQLKAMFFTATGRLLNIPDANPGSPVLVVHLDEYIALEIVSAEELRNEDEESDSEDESDPSDDDDDDDALPVPRRSRKTNIPSTPTRPPASASLPTRKSDPWLRPPQDPFPTSHHLALLESILRLVSLEHTLGTSHLHVPDDLLWAHLSSDQSPTIGSLAGNVPLPPVPSTPPLSNTPTTGGSGSARRRSRRSAAAAPMTPTAKPSSRSDGRPKSRMATLRDGESGSPETPEGKLQRTPAPVRALNLMERFMSVEKGKGSEISNEEGS